jgi:hypothetical protein
MFEWRASPSPSLVCSEHPALSAACPFQFLVYYSVFFVGWGSVCPEGYVCLSQGWLWEYCMLLICSPVGLHLPGRSGASIPVFSVYCGVEKLCTGWGFRELEFCFFLVFFFCQVLLQHLSKIFDLRSSCCLLPPSSHHLQLLFLYHG